MTTKTCKYCGKKCEWGRYKSVMRSATHFINDTYNRFILRDNRPRLYDHDVLCSNCQAEINTYLEEHPGMRKVVIDTATYYSIVDEPIHPTQEENVPIHLHLCINDGKRQMKVVSDGISPRNSLEYVIRQSSIPKLFSVSPYDLAAVSFESDGRMRPVLADEQRMSLHALGLKNNDIVYLRPLDCTPSLIEVYVFGPKSGSQIKISCASTDNINDLLAESIKRFGLQSVSQESIQLHYKSIKFTNEQLYQTFAELNIEQQSVFWIYIDRTRPSADVGRHSPTGSVNREITTVAVKKEILTDNLDKLNGTTDDVKNSSNADVDNYDRTTDADKQQKLPQPLAITETPSSLSVKEEENHVYVDCDFAGTAPFQLTASVSDTVGELIAKITELKEDQSRLNFSLRFNGVSLNKENSDRRLSDLGVKPGDLISAYTRRITSISRSTSASIVGKPAVEHEAASKISVDVRRHDPVGLRNVGNTCYMNSVLQCLSHVVPLRNFFLDFMRPAQTESDFLNPFDSCGPVTGAFAEMIWELCNTNSYTFEPTRLKRVIGERVSRFATFDQQDTQEFMIFLLDAINKELAASHKSDQDTSTIIKDLFHGTMKTKMTCLECRQEKKTMNTIGFLPLPLSQRERVFTVQFVPMNGSPNETTYVPVINSGLIKHVVVNFVEQRPSVSLDQVIVLSLRTEMELSVYTLLNNVLENELIFFEHDSENHKRHEKPTALYRENFPKDLLHCFEEFLTLEMLDDPWYCHGKCNRSTKAAKILELQSLPPVLIVQLKRFAHEKGLRRKLDTLIKFPLDGLDLKQFLPSDTPKEKTIYDLVAVTNHMGSIHGGHYTAYVRQENETDQWYHISDSSVSQTSSSNIVSRDAYLLVYLRRDQKTKI